MYDLNEKLGILNNETRN